MELLTVATVQRELVQEFCDVVRAWRDHDSEKDPEWYDGVFYAALDALKKAEASNAEVDHG